MRGLGKLLLGLLLGAGLVSCAGPKPYDDYALAYVALRAAKDAEASRYSPGYWSKAERLYRDGQQAYKENSNERAKKFFIESKKFAEKAENVTRLKKFQSGGVP
ncbi:MAG: DUF4398 domain-containing protein [Bdellovibrionales bacterium]|nr:DUF4398 domain-containing protein [Bdellovibrionales bacterium]